MDSTQELLERGRRAVERMGYQDLIGEDLERVLGNSPSSGLSLLLVNNLELASKTSSLLTKYLPKYSIYPIEGESSLILVFLAYDVTQANTEVGIAEMWARGRDLYEQAKKRKR